MTKKINKKVKAVKEMKPIKITQMKVLIMKPISRMALQVVVTTLKTILRN